MKNRVLILVLLLASASGLLAQVTVDVSTEQEQFLPGEAIPVAARITNLSGQTLRLGREQGWLTFAIENRDGISIRKSNEVPVPGEFTLDNSKRAVVPVDLAPYFNVVQPGRYTVIATLHLKDWDKQITSKGKAFDIILGAKLWEREIGVPKAAGATNAMPEVRRYTLQQANYLRTQLRLYFQLTDNAGKLNKVIPIGPMLSFGQPDAQVDRVSHLHVLYQNGPHSFSYTEFTPDGDLATRQTFAFDSTSRPRLRADEEGNFTVVGGVRRITADDVPPPTTASNNVTTPAR